MGQPSFTVCVDNVGTPYACIGLDDGSGAVSYYGFAFSTNALLGTHGPGKVSAWREANHVYSLGAILGGENCTTFVQAVARAGGITGIATSGVVHPVSLVLHLAV
ncbi:hypothetical protein SAMN03159371_06066 [Variovorax sp. NFACC28]|nr:hypothetical protein SAMN03159371_06066 [Variovorax sp. NFACC28]SEG94850.1 hypothetical protein SAMN03159365_06144 [Variovorax sp. NFACC29]SFD72783.1 hypothetical protein SAMN03159379_06103 [Variovorax sp. NFACC26]SFG85845.1 hypothetical protein SAMN03159447_05263 [Variovorax sp. NFACC27]